MPEYAFPRAMHGYAGMTLRDYFAGQALVGVIPLITGADSIEDGAELAVRVSYLIADAMLKAMVSG